MDALAINGRKMKRHLVPEGTPVDGALVSDFEQKNLKIYKRHHILFCGCVFHPKEVSILKLRYYLILSGFLIAVKTIDCIEHLLLVKLIVKYLPSYKVPRNLILSTFRGWTPCDHEEPKPLWTPPPPLPKKQVRRVSPSFLYWSTPQPRVLVILQAELKKDQPSRIHLRSGDILYRF